MTGESISTKENWKRLSKYYKKIISGGCIILGTFLMMEHLFMFSGFDLFDWIGHEYYGLALIITGFLLSIKYDQWHTLKLWIFKNHFR